MRGGLKFRLRNVQHAVTFSSSNVKKKKKRDRKNRMSIWTRATAGIQDAR